MVYTQHPVLPALFLELAMRHGDPLRFARPPFRRDSPCGTQPPLRYSLFIINYSLLQNSLLIIHYYKTCSLFAILGWQIGGEQRVNYTLYINKGKKNWWCEIKGLTLSVGCARIMRAYFMHHTMQHSITHARHSQFINNL